MLEKRMGINQPKENIKNNWVDDDQEGSVEGEDVVPFFKNFSINVISFHS